MNDGAVLQQAAAPPSDAVSRTSGRQTGTFGRFIVSARTNHLVSDGRAALGAPGEAITAGELLLGALASCGLGLVQVRAAETGVHLSDARVDATFERDPGDPTRYKMIRLTFALAGATRAEAEDLVGAFAAQCPIYNTLKRGGPIALVVDGESMQPAGR